MSRGVLEGFTKTPFARHRGSSRQPKGIASMDSLRQRLGQGIIIVAVQLVVGCPVIAPRSIAPLSLVDDYETRAGVRTAIFSPDGNDILFAYRQARYQHLYRIGIDGPSCERLTDGKRFDFDPAYSPDGGTIVFSSALGKQRRKCQLFSINADGSGLKALTQAGVMDWGAQFSPDGKRIVFCSSRDGRQTDLFIMNADGTHLEQLTKTREPELYPLFLSNGEEVYFWRAQWYGFSSPFGSSDWHGYDLYKISLSDGRVKQLTTVSRYRLYSPSVSSDGGVVLYSCGRPYGDNLLLFSGNQRSQPVTLRPKGVDYEFVQHGRKNEKVLRCPNLSPDGEAAVFATSNVPSRYWLEPHDLYVMNVKTRETTRITNLDMVVRHPQFSADGTRLVFLAAPMPWHKELPFELWMVNADGSNLRRIQLNIDG